MGVVFLFKYRRSEFEKQRILVAQGEMKPLDGVYDYTFDTLTDTNDPNSVFFARQMIQDACATQAVLSLLLNIQSEDQEACTDAVPISIGPTLSQFKEFVNSFDAELKGEAISNSDEIRAVHNSFSRPTPFYDDKDNKKDRDNQDEENDGLFHFIAYKPVNGKLYEFDGLHPYPIVHEFSDDAGKQTACHVNSTFPKQLAHVLATRIARAPAGDLRFNLIGLTSNKHELLTAMNDIEGLRREAAKRELWHRENMARRANYTQLITELIKGIAGNYKEYPTAKEWNLKVLEPARKKSKEQYYLGQQQKFGFQ